MEEYVAQLKITQRLFFWPNGPSLILLVNIKAQRPKEMWQPG